MFREQSTANLVAKTETSQKNTGDLHVLILKISESIVKSFKFRKEYKVFKFLVRCLIDSCEVFDHQNRIKDFDKPADLESTQDIMVMVSGLLSVQHYSKLYPPSFILLHFIKDS